ncbi:uncharacterized protein LOC123312209 isoform X4 [Coccinella septempunctata]|uniref:uncharacterized protein LOC123312209 isoform X4 n=1 Tax=Coccinella septempunctata TaxID=41139 RepID=UPI001D062EFE|nr:uncharacterized protein LOC123312209 isoform X4 [Coccinella septempunctata]
MLTANVLCLKRKKKKKGEYILNLPGTILVNDGKHKGQKAGNMLHITEDTPADMLSGAMDLSIHLPTGKTVKMCVERRTPMMDLLVQVTTNHQLQITNYTLQPLQTSSSDNYSEKVLSYYPNTPIGALDTQHIKVIPKTRTLPITKNALPVTQPFETTFRLKVHLPRNQLYVTRVSKHVHIEDIMRKVCEEKSLDPNKYEVRHPGNLDEILDPKLTLHDYMITEINLVVKGSNRNSQIFTSDDIMTLKKEEERKVTSNKSGGGVFNLLFRRGKSNNTPTTTPPANKEPPPSTLHREDPPTKPTPQTVAKSEPQKEKPKVPQRKRRPAPKPPQPVEKPPQEEPVQLRNGSVISDSSNVSENGAKHGSGVTICHSRHSSDSSGYHETSILSDQCNTSLPRRNRMGEGAETMGRLKLNRYSESTGNLTKMTSQSRSTSSLIFPGRKKKAAPPPPKPLQTPSSSTTNLESPVVASQTPLSSSSSKTDVSSTTNHPPHKTFNSDGKSCNNSQIVSPLEEKEVCISENLYTTDIINEISLDDVERYKNYGNSPDSGNSSEISEKSKIDDELNNPEILEALVAEDEVIEEWQLPSPPKAFKDTFPNSQLKETSETDSVITPELIEKLERIEKEQAVHNEQNRKNSVSDDLYADNELILNKLSLENLEKRKSLVYNRELATSLKLSYESEALKKVATDSSKPDSSKTLDKSDKTQEEIRQAVKKEEATTESKHSTLPNFKITTYEEPKQIKVFEDDTIRSNSDFSGKSLSLNRGRTLDKTGFGRSMENISVRKNESDDVFKRPKDAEHRTFRPISEHYRRPVNRSGSFSAEHNEWSSSRPVARSKSQVALRRGERKNVGFESSNMSKSSSLFDVSGLQSLEVMKKIQNKLNTPTTSMETLSKAVSEKIEAKPKAAEVQEPPKRKYQYTGPPSINMGTWSERPKVPVSVKEDADYKLGQGTNNRYLNTTVQNGSRIIDVKEQKFVGEIASKQAETQTVTITCNGSSERKDFNVLIKIEDQNRRFQDQKVDSMYKTSYSLNRNSQRPHSVAFPSDFDISRVPVVRSVELKKTFRDIPGNTSVIQLNQSNDNYHPNSFSERYTTNTTSKDVSKPVMRAKSFLQGAPVVRGFRTLDNNTISTNNTEVKVENSNRYSWQPTTSMTLPSAPKKDTFTTNQNVPFSRFNLRRTESKNSRDDDWGVQDRTQTLPSFSKPHFEPHQNGNLVNTNSKPEIPKPPPQMPKTIQKKITQRQFVPVLDPRDELLKSIRDFGGKKGLRSRKA